MLRWMLVGVAFVLGCEVSDLGAPCNHGPARPSETLVVTFPALACNDLVCVYADRKEPPVGPCERHADCNVPGDPAQPFRCDEGRCEVATQHVLDRSMCSQFCDADADCRNVDEGSECKSGFACVPPQDLGDYCCQKMCICMDELDLASARIRAEQCEAGTHEGCCQKTPKPDACGPG